MKDLYFEFFLLKLLSGAKIAFSMHGSLNDLKRNVKAKVDSIIKTKATTTTKTTTTTTNTTNTATTTATNTDHTSSPKKTLTSATNAFFNAFPELKNESIIGEFWSSYVNVLPHPGTIYITRTSFCFVSMLKFYKIHIPLSQISKVEKNRAMYLIDIAFTIKTTKGDRYYFSNTPRRDDCFNMINQAKINSHRKGDGESGDDDHHDVNNNNNDNDQYKKVKNNIPSIQFDKILNIKMLVLGNVEDLYPFLYLSNQLIQHGHMVTICSHRKHEVIVNDFNKNLKNKIFFSSISGDPVELTKFCIEKGTFTPQFVNEGREKYMTLLSEIMYTSYESLKNSSRADLLISNPPHIGAPHIAEKLKIPLFIYSTTPWTRTSMFLHPFAYNHSSSFIDSFFKYHSYTMVDRTLKSSTETTIINDFRVLIGLPHWNNQVKSDYDNVYVPRLPHIYAFSEYLIRRPHDWEREPVHITGLWNSNDKNMKEFQPDSKLKAFLDTPGSSQPLFFSFKGCKSPKYYELLNLFLEFFKSNSNYRAIFLMDKSTSSSGSGSGGASGSGSGSGSDNNNDDDDDAILKNLSSIRPSQFFLVDGGGGDDSAELEWIMKRCSLIIHHGGSYTTSLAICSGKPMIVIPFFGDHYFWGDMITKAEIGNVLNTDYASHMKCDYVSNIINNTLKLSENAKLLSIRVQSHVNNSVHVIHYEYTRWAKSHIKSIDSVTEEKSTTTTTTTSSYGNMKGIRIEYTNYLDEKFVILKSADNLSKIYAFLRKIKPELIQQFAQLQVNNDDSLILEMFKYIANDFFVILRPQIQNFLEIKN
eukprot:TRINITY_DN360_c5_g1_i1.p1 TRINITY_DN360_c5_g1~~TRINITY_DN360_c5_g1_i1.p1  ORF type:complete len:812 (-),score=200.61 TRINITY_DN360_c5_g1_i1:95-2530(-)